MAEEFPAARSIEAFFLNPTFIMDSQSQEAFTNPSKAAGYSSVSTMSPLSAHRDAHVKFDLNHDRDTSSATITSVAHEPVFWHGYTSDEEAASPLELDDLDWNESDDASIADLPPLSPIEEKRAAIVNQAHQLCTHAQAVTILSAGRPKMVSVPKLIDASRPEHDLRVSSLPNQFRERIMPPHLRTHSLDASGHDRSSSEYSQKDSLDSVGGVSPLSTAPSSLHEYQPRSHRTSVSSKHVPLMEAARSVSLMEAARLASQVSPSSPVGLKGSYTWSQPMAPTSAPTSRSSISHIKSGVSALINRFDSSDAAARRVAKPGTNSIGRMGKKIVRRDTLEDVEDEYLSRMAVPEHQLSQPASPIIRLPVRNTSSQPTRMVARGASERAPVLTLPVFPDEPIFSPDSEWPLFTMQSTHAPTARITTVA